MTKIGLLSEKLRHLEVIVVTFAEKRQKWSTFWMRIFGNLELSKLTFIPKFHWIPITITKVAAFLSYCSNFCKKTAKNGQNFGWIFFLEFDVPKRSMAWKFGQFLITVTLKKQQSLRRRTTRRRTRVILKPCMCRVKKCVC